MRKCLATQAHFPKKELIRIVRTPQKEVVVDLTGKANGRGAYLNKSVEAIELAQKTNVLARALEVDIPEAIYQQLLELLNE